MLTRSAQLIFKMNNSESKYMTLKLSYPGAVQNSLPLGSSLPFL